MSHRKQLDELFDLSRSLDASILLIRNEEILPLSFFSRIHDILKSMNTVVHTLEMKQLEEMQEKLNAHKEMLLAFESLREVVKFSDVSVRKETNETIAVVEASEKSAPAPLKDIIEKRILSDLRKAISLNDKFRFQRELFGGSADAMNETIDALNAMSSPDEAQAYLQSRFAWDWEDGAAADLRMLLEKIHA